MAISDISLTAGMRSNLINLQDTSQLLDRTQERLSTGKKVNSALDDPTSFFAAQALTQRASDLSTLKDSMGQAVQTIQAANQGITGITTLIQAAQGLAQSALSTSDTTTRLNYAQQFDAIRTQIDNMAQDSGYNGTNLLGGTTVALKVTFDLASSSSLTVTGVDGSTAATGLNVSAAATNWTTTDNTAISSAITSLAGANTTLRNDAASLSSSLTIINARQDFTNQMISTLSTGADNLTLADMNEEGANMLMLQTRQSLGITALSLSSQAAQSILKLFA